MAFNYEFPYVDPNIYNDDWLLSKMKELLGWMERTDEWKNEYEQAYEDFKTLVEDIEKGNFPPSIVNAFNDYMEKYGLELVGKLVKMVFFGITEEGYFVAYIPEYWEDLTFNTSGYDISLAGYDFGHLVLSY